MVQPTCPNCDSRDVIKRGGDVFVCVDCAFEGDVDDFEAWDFSDLNDGPDVDLLALDWDNEETTP